MYKHTSQTVYQKNIEFWEQAWLRVKKPSHKIPDVLDYIPDIPKVFGEHNCKHILDIACGSGWLSFYLNEHGFKVTGIDISESAIKLANQVLDQRRQPGSKKLFEEGLSNDKINLDDIKFQAADMFDMDFPEDEFDGILINACFEHLDYARGQEFLHKIKKIIKPNGIMFGVYDKVASGDKGTYEVLEDGSHQYNDEMRDGMILRYYSDPELNNLLEESSWQVLSLCKNKFESRIVIARNIK